MKRYYSSLHIRRVKVIKKGKTTWKLRGWRGVYCKIKNRLLNLIESIRDIFFFEFKRNRKTETISESYFQLDKLGRIRRKRMPKWNEKKLIALSIETEE